jgi:outer membrane lipoprotein SlyB
MDQLYKFFVTMAVILLVGCATSNSGDVYTRDQTRQLTKVKMATVESVRAVKIEGTKSLIGTGAGAVIGGVAGKSVGDGKGSIIAAVVGAVAGGLAGSAIEEGVTRKDGIEITVKIDGGKDELVAIVQEASGEEFHPGDRVRIIDADGDARVSH